MTVSFSLFSCLVLFGGDNDDEEEHTEGHKRKRKVEFWKWTVKKESSVSCFGDQMKQLAVNYQFDAAKEKETVLTNRWMLTSQS